MKTSRLSSMIAIFMLLCTNGIQSQTRQTQLSQDRSKDPFENGFRSAEVKIHNGAPTFFLDGKPAFYGVWWVSPPTTDGWPASGITKKNSVETGIHIYAFDVGPAEWCGPAPGRSAHYDFSTVQARFNRILEADPKALFHLRIYLEISEPQSQWWHDLYPEEREILSDGTLHRQSFASTVWREQANNFLRAYIAHLKKNTKFNYVIDDIMNTHLMAELVDLCEIVYHLAAAVGVKLIVESPVHTIETNIKGTEIVLNLANKKKKKVVMASTSEVYGKGAKVPFAEGDDLLLGPTFKSRWSYACSKAIDEFLALAYWKEKKLPTIVVRLFNTVGPRQSGQYGMVVPRFIVQALKNQPLTVYGDGSQSRCFTWVGDVVDALIKLSNLRCVI